MRLMERLGSQGSGTGKQDNAGIFDTLKDYEQRIKDWCTEQFPDKEMFDNQSERLYKLDHTRVKKLEEEMAKL